MNVNRSGRMVRLGATALAAGFLATAAIALPASAVGPGNIDPDEPVSLSIHKRTQPNDAGSAGSGLELGNPPGEGLAGVTFSVQRLTDLDLLNPDHWEGLEDLTVQDVENNGMALGPDVGGTTDANGDLILGDAVVDIGVYLVRETDSPDSVVAPAAPFLVTLPMPGPNQSPLWNYNVHVYPKNALAGTPSKTINDATAYELGDTITWTVNAPATVLTANDDYTTFIIRDDLDSRVDFTSATLSWDGVPALVAGDYTLTPAAATVGGPEITATLTAAGLAKLNAQDVQRNFSLVINGTLNDIGDGSIENTAFVNVNGTERATNEVETLWGALDVRKHEANDIANRLAGAEFDVYTQRPTADNVPVAPIATGVTDDDGTFASPIALKVGTYYLVERVAPAGYQLPANFDDRVTEVVITEGDLATPDVYDIANVQQPPYTLPLTGGTGAMVFTLTGAALLIGGAAFYVIARRRSTQAINNA